MPNGGIDYLIYSGQRKTILWTGIIQVGVINVDPPLSIFFQDYHHVHQSI